MQILSESVIHFPIEHVYATYRDRLPEIAPYMQDIREIKVISRVDRPDGADLLNRWFAQTELPKVAQGIVKPEWMQWDDHARWDDTAQHVDWRLELPALKDQVRCSGRNSFTAVEGGTRVRLEGTLDLDLRKIPGVPGFMAKRIQPQVEKFIVRLITPNLEKVNASLERFLEADA